MSKEGCVFCGKIKTLSVDDLFDDMDIAHFEPLNPVTPGHRLFVPVLHREHPFPLYVGKAMKAAEAWARKFGEDYNLITSSGPSATQTIDHIHVHYVPRREGDGLHLPWTGQQR